MILPQTFCGIFVFSCRSQDSTGGIEQKSMVDLDFDKFMETVTQVSIYS